MQLTSQCALSLQCCTVCTLNARVAAPGAARTEDAEARTEGRRGEVGPVRSPITIHNHARKANGVNKRRAQEKGTK